MASDWSPLSSSAAEVVAAAAASSSPSRGCHDERAMAAGGLNRAEGSVEARLPLNTSEISLSRLRWHFRRLNFLLGTLPLNRLRVGPHVLTKKRTITARFGGGGGRRGADKSRRDNILTFLTRWREPLSHSIVLPLTSPGSVASSFSSKLAAARV